MQSVITALVTLGTPPYLRVNNIYKLQHTYYTYDSVLITGIEIGLQNIIRHRYLHSSSKQLSGATFHHYTADFLDMIVR